MEPKIIPNGAAWDGYTKDDVIATFNDFVNNGKHNDELDSLRTQLAAEIERREKAEGECGRIRNRALRVFQFYFDSVMHGVKKDFGVSEVDGEREISSEWFNDTVDFLLEVDAEDVEIKTPTEFLDAVDTEHTGYMQIKQALQKSEAEKVELAEVVVILNKVIEKAKALDIEPETWNALYKATETVELVAKAEAIIERGKK